MKSRKKGVWLLGVVVMGSVLVVQWLGARPAQTAAAQKYGSIAGRVVRPDGSPVRDVRVAAMPIAESGEPSNGRGAAITLISLSRTDDAGRYLLTGIPEGRYFITAGALDDHVYFPGVFSPSEARALTVVGGGILPVDDFRLPQLSFSVRGRVIREQHNVGEQIALIGDARDRRSSVRAPLAPDGSFEFSNVRRGTYQVQVSPNLCLTPIEVLVGRDIAELEIPIPASAVLAAPVEFNVSVEGEGLVPLVQITLTRTTRVPATHSCEPPLLGPITVSSAMPFGMLSPRGSWSLQGPNWLGIVDPPLLQPIVPGEYTIAPLLTPLPPGYVLKSVTSGATNLMKEPLKVTASGAPPVEIQLAVHPSPPWLRVEGRVTDLDKSNVKPAEIRIEDPLLASALVAEVRADGTFEFPMVLPGNYQVRPRILLLSGCEFGPACQNVAVAKKMTIGGDGVARIEIPAAYFDRPDLPFAKTSPQTGPTVSGRLFIDGKPAPLRFSLRLKHFGYLTRESRVLIEAASDGTFSFAGEDGVYGVTTALPFGLALQSMDQGGVDIASQPLAVSSYYPKAIQLHVTTEPRNWATVSGRVTGIDSSRAIVLTLTGGELRREYEAPVNPDGTFRFAGVPQGSYELVIRNADGVFIRPVSGTLLIGELVSDGIHKAEDAAGLEIVVPTGSDAPAMLRQVEGNP